METQTQKYQELATKTLAVIGLLAILILVSFSIISIARYAEKPLSYLLSAAVGLTQVFVPAPHLNLSADSVTVASGKAVTFSWSSLKKDGSYAFSYACLDGFHFETIGTDGKSSTVACDSPLSINQDTTHLVLTPISTKNHFVDMPVLLTFTKSGDEEVMQSGTFTLTVSNDTLGAVATPVNPKPTIPSTTHSGSGVTAGNPSSHTYTYPTTGGTGTYDNPNGTADLAATILETGVLDKFTNAFAPLATTSLSRSDRIAVRFSVENLGTKSTGVWRFNAVLPTYPPTTFNSDAEPSLAPGDKIDFTIGFDQTLSGAQTVKIILDPQENVKEVSETNNTATLNLNIN